MTMSEADRVSHNLAEALNHWQQVAAMYEVEIVNLNLHIQTLENEIAEWAEDPGDPDE